MKNTIKTILLFFTVALVLTSCSSDDKNPPTAGFTMSNMEPYQWDTSTVIVTAIGYVDIVFTVSGGDYEWVDEATIQFLEDASYTITQTVINEDGEDSTSLTAEAMSPENVYSIAGTELEINESAQWKIGNPNHGTSDLIEFIADVSDQDFPNYIRVTPYMGTNALEGTYTFDVSNEVGTYTTRVIANYDPTTFSSDWTTDFDGMDGGTDLIIELVYEGSNADNNVYDITIVEYTLSTGYLDWTTFEFVEVEKKTFSMYYRGTISVPVVPA